MVSGGTTEVEEPGLEAAAAIERGAVWWADLPDPVGSSPGYRRPVLVLQADSFNRSRIATIVVAVITKNVELARAPGNVLLTRRQSGLPVESVVNVSQLITLDRAQLTEQVARLLPKKLAQVEAGVRLVLAL